jgi:CBS domain-containing protein
VDTIEVGAPLVDAVDLLRRQRSGLLVVAHAGRPVGLRTGADVLRAMIRPSAATG